MAEPRFKVGDRVRTRSAVTAAGTPLPNPKGTEYVVTAVREVAWPPPGVGSFYCAGDPAGFGVWELFLESAGPGVADLAAARQRMDAAEADANRVRPYGADDRGNVLERENVLALVAVGRALADEVERLRSEVADAKGERSWG